MACSQINILPPTLSRYIDLIEAEWQVVSKESDEWFLLMGEQNLLQHHEIRFTGSWKIHHILSSRMRRLIALAGRGEIHLDIETIVMHDLPGHQDFRWIQVTFLRAFCLFTTWSHVLWNYQVLVKAGEPRCMQVKLGVGRHVMGVRSVWVPCLPPSLSSHTLWSLVSNESRHRFVALLDTFFPPKWW